MEVIQKYLSLGRSYPEIVKLCRCSMSTIRKVKGALVEVGDE
jgi:transposase